MTRIARALVYASMLGVVVLSTPDIPTIHHPLTHHSGYASVVGLPGDMPVRPRSDRSAMVEASYGSLPLGFEENRGQTDPEVRFVARAAGYNIFLTDQKAVMAFADGRVLRLGLTGRSAKTRISTLDRLPGRTSYITGRDLPRQVGIPSYGRISFEDVYPGIDQVFYGKQRQLEYDLVVRPGADPRRIRMRIEGTAGLRLNAAGDLLLGSGSGEPRMSRPVVWQEVDGRREPIECHYVLTGEDEVGLEVGSYDSGRTLVIDPVIQYATFLGGGAGDTVLDLAIDGEGNAYVTGWTYSIDYPTIFGGQQITPPVRAGGGTSAFVTKLNPTGTAAVYSTYLGALDSRAHSLAVDLTGNVYVTGSTTNRNFPVTEGAMQTSPIGIANWSFVTKLSPDGSDIVYSTFVTGLTGVNATTIAVDTTGAVVIAGSAGDGFPTTPEAYQVRFKGGRADGFIARLDPIGASFEYATYLGGSDFEQIRAVAIDSLGQACVTGVTTRPFNVPSVDNSTGIEPLEVIPFSDFPITRGAFETRPRGRSDAFVTKIKADGAALIYSTFLGGSGEEMDPAVTSSADPWTGRTIAVDSIGNVYVTGITQSTDFPTTAGSLQRQLAGGMDLFVSKLNVFGTRLLFSTYLGGASRDSGEALAIDSAGNLFLTGWTLSSNFPITPDGFRKKTPDGSGIPAVFVTYLEKSGATLSYSTYLGGSGGEQATCIAVSQAGSTYLGGFTNSADFPTTPRTYRPQPIGQQDGFVVRIAPGGGTVELTDIAPRSGGDAGSVWAVIQGLQFKEGVIAKLVREDQPEIVGTTVNAGSDGRTISVLFNLAGKSRGLWDVVVINPDGTTAVLPKSFTVEAAREPAIRIDVQWGPASIRTGQRQQYWISYSNTGNNDAYGVPVWIKLRGTSPVRIISDVSLPAPLSGDTAIDWAQVPTSLTNTDTGQVVPVVLAVVPAGRVGYIGIEIAGPSQVGAAIPLEAWATQSIFASADPNLNLLVECYRTIIRSIAAQTGVSILPTCDADIAGSWKTLISAAIQQSLQTGNRQPRLISLNHLLTAVTMAGVRCVRGTATLNQINGAVSRSVGVRDDLRTCLGNRLGYVYRIVTVARSYAQFFNLGVGGFSEDHYVPEGRMLEYAIGFENPPTARAAVRELTITDQLDPDAVDPLTFAFGPIVIANRMIVPMPGQTVLEADIDLRPTRNVIVRVIAAMRSDTGQVTWRFTAIDPLTGQIPIDSSTGFLPPNIVSPQGSGAVGYTVAVRPGLTTGSIIANQPIIAFDQEGPNLPEPWTNKLDSARPASRVEALPVTVQAPNFLVRWQGTDSGSGISDYTIYVAVDQGPWQVWQTNVTTTSATYNGSLGRRYSFYSVARDNVQNVEDPPLGPSGSAGNSVIIPDTTTIIQNYDVGMQDDRSGHFLLFNSISGEFFLNYCGPGGFTMSGRGQIGQSGTMMTLTSALLVARLERRQIAPFFGDARFKQSAVGVLYNILDRNASNNTWRCSQ